MLRNLKARKFTSDVSLQTCSCAFGSTSSSDNTPSVYQQPYDLDRLRNGVTIVCRTLSHPFKCGTKPPPPNHFYKTCKSGEHYKNVRLSVTQARDHEEKVTHDDRVSLPNPENLHLVCPSASADSEPGEQWPYAQRVE